MRSSRPSTAVPGLAFRSPSVSLRRMAARFTLTCRDNYFCRLAITRVKFAAGGGARNLSRLGKNYRSRLAFMRVVDRRARKSHGSYLARSVWSRYADCVIRGWSER
jgi:hypothetical protein